MIDENVKIVIFDNPIETWEQPITQDLFHKVVQMKLAGYAAEYPSGVIAVDGTDFFGTHLLICREQRDGFLTPLVGYKSVTLRRCEHHRAVFSALGILRNSKADDSKLLEIMESSKKRDVNLSYDGSWTTATEVRHNKEFSKFARDLLTTISVFYHEQFNVPEWTVCGIPRFKTDQYFRWLGHSEICQPFAFFNLKEEPATMLHLPRHSPEAIAKANEMKSHWDRKIVISKETMARKTNLKVAA